MAFKITSTEAHDAAEVADFQCAAFGGTTQAAISNAKRLTRGGKAFVAQRRGQIIATLFLTTRKPWAIDTSYFTPVRIPLYLLGMAVAPSLQRTGIGSFGRRARYMNHLVVAEYYK
jgi:predicted N-acetyltransferase YhbS